MSREFLLRTISKNYDAIIKVDSCQSENCFGKASIELFRKNSKILFQQIASPNLFLTLTSEQQVSTHMELYDEQSPIIFDDFNFDGTEDVAIRNGNESAYGGPSYDIYVYNITKKKFVASKALTKLASKNLGMFTVDKIKKQLRTFNKSGCCWHITESYKVSPKNGLQKIYELVEDATQGNEMVLVTEKKIVHGKWTTNHKRYKMSVYYKE